MAHLSAAEKKKIQCNFFNRGTCRHANEADCGFKHREVEKAKHLKKNEKKTAGSGTEASTTGTKTTKAKST